MATVSAYQTNGGKRYRVRYRTPENRQTDRRGFRTLREAKAYAATVEVSKLRGEYVAPSDGRVTVGQLGPGWLARQGHHKPSHTRTLETAWRVHVEPEWGPVPIGDIRPSMVQGWVSKLSGRRGPTVVIRAFGVLAGVLDEAVRDRRLVANPARGTSLPRKRRAPEVFLTHAQVAGLAAAAGEHGTLVLLLAYTGLRWSEATELRVRDLDLLRRRLTVSRNAVRTGSSVVVGTPKSNRGRPVPLPGLLLEPLAAQCAGRGRDDLLFPNRAGGHLRPSKWFAAACRDAGLPPITPHGLRHVCAGLAVQSGASVKAVSAMLGHRSAAMTLDRYAALFSADLDDVADRMDAAARNVGGEWARAAVKGSK